MASPKNREEAEEEKEMEGEEPVMTLGEYIEAEEEMEEMAEAVLGPSEGSTCTYSKGYMKRQALYSCLTCHPLAGGGKVDAGVCLPCAELCHTNHDLVELYTKRHFRCDCGNSKFKDLKCQLVEDKSGENEENKYNQNFSGLYCACHRPYPDPDPQDDVDGDEMVQCVICEDWFHTKHLGGVGGESCSRAVALSPAVDSVTCAGCVERCPFLARYTHLHIVPITKEDGDVSVEVDGEGSEVGERKREEIGEEKVERGGETLKEGDVGEGIAEEKLEGAERGEEKADEKLVAGGCKRQHLAPASGAAGALYWTKGWRAELCSCDQCKREYEAAGVGFLLDVGDELEMYESRGSSGVDGAGGSCEGRGTKRSAQEEMMSFLSKYDRVVQMEMIHGYNEMKENLSEFFLKMQSSGKVMTAADVTGFFEELKSKRKRTAVNIQHSCK